MGSNSVCQRLYIIIMESGPLGIDVEAIHEAYHERHGPIDRKSLLNRLSTLYKDRGLIGKLTRGIYCRKEYTNSRCSGGYGGPVDEQEALTMEMAVAVAGAMWRDDDTPSEQLGVLAYRSAVKIVEGVLRARRLDRIQTQ